MGQYVLTVNLDKKEFIQPHKLGSGLKLMEQVGYSPGGPTDALLVLLAISNGRGGGDAPDSEWVGRWGGDRIRILGDYAEDSDLPAEFKAGSIYGECRDSEDGAPGAYRDITDELIPYLEEACEIIYFGSGWRRRASLHELFAGWECSHLSGSGRVAKIKGKNYPLEDLIRRAKTHLAGDGKGAELPIDVEALPKLPDPHSASALRAFEIEE